MASNTYTSNNPIPLQQSCSSSLVTTHSDVSINSQLKKKNTAIKQLRQVTAQSLFPIIPIQPAATLRHSSQCGVPPNLVAIDHWHNLFPRYTLQRHTKIKVQTLTLPGRHDEVWNQQQLSKGIQTNHWNTYSKPNYMLLLRPWLHISNTTFKWKFTGPKALWHLDNYIQQ